MSTTSCPLKSLLLDTLITPKMINNNFKSSKLTIPYTAQNVKSWYIDIYFDIYTSTYTKMQYKWLYKAPGNGSTKHR
jgi:hypothetical protein